MKDKNITTLGKLGKVRMCKRVLKHQTSELGSIPFYKISTFGDKAQVFISKELYKEFKDKYPYPKIGDVLISAAGTIGKTVIFDGEPSYFQDSNIVWIENDEAIVTNSFLYYFYQTSPWVSTNGSTIKRLYNDNLRSIKITYPKLEQQKQIAKVLSDLDAKIEVNNQINQQLEAMAKTLYDYWFVQFDFPISTPLDAGSNVSSSAVENDLTTSNKEPVSTALDMTSCKPYKSSGGKMVYNAELKREIPDGWEVDTLGNHISYNRGISYTSKSTKSGDGIPMINLKSFNLNGSYRIDGLKYYNGKFNKKKSIKSGDLLIAITDVTRNAEIIGKAILTPNLGDTEMVASCDISLVICGETVDKNYIRYLFNSDHYHNYIKHFASGTLVLHLDLKGVDWYQDVIPPISLQKRFGDIVQSYFEKGEAIRKENQKLTELRDWLLPMLMNGQATVGSPDVNRDELNSVSSALDLTTDKGSSSAKPTVSSSAVENELGRVAEGGATYGKN